MENIDTSGFYKQAVDGPWMHAPNFVYGFDFELIKEKKDTYTYPVDGWTWYDENIEIYNLIHNPKETEEDLESTE